MASVRRTSWGLMVGLSLGHALKRFCQQAFLLLIPSFKAAMALTDQTEHGNGRTRDG